MQTKKALATIALGASLSLTGATAASAAPQNAQAAGLIAAAVNANDTVDIDRIGILQNDGTIRIIRDVNVQNNNILTGIVVQALNNNDIRVNDVVDVFIQGSVLVVDVL